MTTNCAAAGLLSVRSKQTGSIGWQHRLVMQVLVGCCWVRLRGGWAEAFARVLRLCQVAPVQLQQTKMEKQTGGLEK